MPPQWPTTTGLPGNRLRFRRAFAYAIDASPIWLSIALGAWPVLVVQAKVSLLHAVVLDDTTGKPLPAADIPDAADFALRWVPALAFVALTQLFAIDIAAATVGKLAAGLRVVDASSGDAVRRSRLFLRELLRSAPVCLTFVASGLLAACRALFPSLCVLGGGLAFVAVATAFNALRVAGNRQSLLDASTHTRVLNTSAAEHG